MGQRLVVVLKRDAVARVVLNNLYKHTELPVQLQLQHARAGRRRPAHAQPRRVHQQLGRPPDRRHPAPYPGYGCARRRRTRTSIADSRRRWTRSTTVIALIRRSQTTDEAREGLMELLEIDEIQATAILNMQLRRLAALERQSIVDRLVELERTIADLEDILGSEQRQRDIVSTELQTLVDKYGDARRSQIIPADGDLSMEDLIPDEDVVITITRGGYAKRTRADLYRLQKRGGKGVRGATLQGDDIVEHFFSSTNHHWLLFFTTAGPGLPDQGLPPAGVGARREGRPRRRPAVLPARRADRAGAGDPGLRAGAVPRARDPQRVREEDPARRLRLGAPGRGHRHQLPRGRRRADRRRAGDGRRRPAAGLAQGPVGPLPCRRHAAAADGSGDQRASPA